MNLKSQVKERALEAGFDLVGVAPSTAWRDLDFAQAWVECGYGGDMKYLRNPLRADPRLILPSVKSIVCVGLVYNTPLPYSTEVSCQPSVVSPELSAVSRHLSVVQSQKSGTNDRTLEAENRNPNREPRSRNGREPTDNGQKSAIGNRQSTISESRAPSPEPRRSEPRAEPRGWISRYAWGRDYHRIMRSRLERLRAEIEQLAPGVETRVYVDTGPVVERAFARLSGIGWMGKNTCLINQQKGSWFFIGVILTSLKLEPDTPAFDRCGSCRRCLDACPTGALVEPYVMDASRCIAYFNIELKGSIPAEFRPAIGANVFGCDICQDVCPWNRPLSVVRGPSPPVRSSWFVDRSSASERGDRYEDPGRIRRRVATTELPEFYPLAIERPAPEQPKNPQIERVEPASDGRRTADNGQRTTNYELRTFSLFNPRLEDLASLTEDDFRRLFRDSPIRRVKYRGWLRNLCVVIGNFGDRRFLPWLEEMRVHPDTLVREHAEWAIRRMAES